MSEAELQIMVADYIRIKYPNVLFHSDFGSGIKLTPGQAIKQKRQNGGRRAWPDLFIAEPIRILNAPEGILGVEKVAKYYCGLFLELKKDGTRLKKKDGKWASDHIKEQNEMLERLTFRGYAANFAIGFDDAKNQIDNYLGGKNVSI